LVAPDRADTGDPLADLVAGMGESDPAPREPEDPAVRRLLPTAHRTDADQAAEFRALTEHSLRGRKVRVLTSAMEALSATSPPVVDLSGEQAQDLLVALTDVRLVLGERLGLKDDDDSAALHEEVVRQATDEPDDEDVERAQRAAYYDFLSWLQETLAASLLDRR
ncbi:MAG TPA: DUF2017 family protein, partial [Ornithinimicrobium sp.]|uniref:DUF2017 family protein n=1 Tax=Ornithinimicrobium sp. TaxID=1977084 RepID=UPI002B45FF7D